MTEDFACLKALKCSHAPPHFLDSCRLSISGLPQTSSNPSYKWPWEAHPPPAPPLSSD
jgi:hypothetical protein